MIEKLEQLKGAVAEWSSDQWDAIKGDGCTGIPDLYLESPCTRHDRHYRTKRHRDGTPITRFEADVELLKDAWKALPIVPVDAKLTLTNSIPFVGMTVVRAVVKPVVPLVVFAGVRAFGWIHW